MLEFSIAGGPVQQASITLVATDTAHEIADKLNTRFQRQYGLSAAGLVASR